jgi:hypothetical protein
MASKLPPSLSGLKFTFLQEETDKIPSTCPPVKRVSDGKIINRVINAENPEKSQYPATEKYSMLGSFVAYKILRRGFEDDPRYDYIGYWNDKCSTDEAVSSITEKDVIEKFDEMQYKELGNLTTGATTLLGFIGQKAVLDGNNDVAGDIYERLMKFAYYIEDGEYKRSDKSVNGTKSCTGKAKEMNCDDSLSRTFLGVGMMTAAAVKKGLFTGQKPAGDLVKRTIEKSKLGSRQTGSAFEKMPYKTGAETLYRCVIESKPGSLKRDQCMESIKDVMVEGILKDDKDVYDDGIASLDSWYHDPTKEPEKWKENVGQWVDSTIWMADGLIRVLKQENENKRKLEGTSKLIDAMADQKREGPEEFSTADWIAQQALVVLANGKSFNRHDEIIKKINEDRLNIWNPWLKVYLDSKDLAGCTENDKTCMGDHTSDRNATIRQLSKSILFGCLKPYADELKKKEYVQQYKRDAVKRCSEAISSLIEKAGDDKTLRVVTEPYFWFGQDDGGYHFIPEFKEAVQKGINNRFTPTFVSKMDEKKRITEKEEGGVATEIYETFVFKNRPFKFEGSTPTEKKKYLIGVKLKQEGKSEAEIIRAE